MGRLVHLRLFDANRNYLPDDFIGTYAHYDNFTDPMTAEQSRMLRIRIPERFGYYGAQAAVWYIMLAFKHLLPRDLLRYVLAQRIYDTRADDCWNASNEAGYRRYVGLQ